MEVLSCRNLQPNAHIRLVLEELESMEVELSSFFIGLIYTMVVLEELESMEVKLYADICYFNFPHSFRRTREYGSKSLNTLTSPSILSSF